MNQAGKAGRQASNVQCGHDYAGVRILEGGGVRRGGIKRRWYVKKKNPTKKGFLSGYKVLLVALILTHTAPDTC